MKTYNITICTKYRLSAKESLYWALQKLGFQHAHLEVRRGCHWGNIWFLNDDLTLAKSLADDEKRFMIVTNGRRFLIYPSGTPAVEEHWQYFCSLI